MTNRRGRNKHYEDILEQGKDLISFYNANPCVAAYDLLGVDLAPIQRLVFKDMWFKNYVIAVCGRGFGKTYLLGLLSVLSCTKIKEPLECEKRIFEVEGLVPSTSFCVYVLLSLHHSNDDDNDDNCANCTNCKN